MNDIGIPDSNYRAPIDLATEALSLRRVMVLGSCLAAGYPPYVESTPNGCPCDFLLINNIPTLPRSMPAAATEYDFQLVQIPLRSVLREFEYFRLNYEDRLAYERLFEECGLRLRETLDAAMRWNLDHGLLSFVWNFLVPQQNPMGRLLPRYDLRNMVHFVEKLNAELAEQVLSYHNAYLFDFDSLVASLGRRYYQDDAVLHLNHAAALTDNDYQYDLNRLDGAKRASDYYPTKQFQVVQASWNEILAMYRTIRQVDQVKLVVLDLDDTLWRGVAAENVEIDPNAVEGWPLGLIEAIGYLRRRGVLLAIVSKNDERTVDGLWGRIFHGRLAKSDFTAVRIDWKPKAENIEELLAQINVLPQNVLFVDDNPAERAGVKAAFPGIRALGPNPLLWRRILLWSPEAQVANVTTESGLRTEMVRAQITREEHRQRLTRDEFLKSLRLNLRFFEVDDAEHPAYSRCFELLNKTNQFNTTGRRWVEAELRVALTRDLRLFAFGATDVYTDYGLVGVILVDRGAISQFVMSCRVAGMDIEVAAVSELMRSLCAGGVDKVEGIVFETPLNLLSRDVYARCGFQDSGEGRWSSTVIPVVPSHIVTTNEVTDRAMHASKQS